MPAAIRAGLSSDPAYNGNLARLTKLEKQLEKIPTVETPVMAGRPAYEGRRTLDFERGNFLTKIGPVLNPDVPGIFPPFRLENRCNRLTFGEMVLLPRTASYPTNRR